MEIMKSLEALLPPNAKKRKLGEAFYNWNWAWPIEEVKKLLEFTKEFLSSENKTHEEKGDYLSDLEDVFEYSEKNTTKFDIVINYLISFVLEYNLGDGKAEEMLKEDVFYAIGKAQDYQDMSNIDFYPLANKLPKLSTSLLRASIEALVLTQNKDFLPYILPYKDHENEDVRYIVNFGIKYLKGNTIEEKENVQLQTQSKQTQQTMDKTQLILDIKNKGYNISSIEDLPNLNLDLKSQNLVSLLLKGLKSIEDEQDKAFIVKCLCIKGLTQVSETLLYEFENASTDDYKCTIGNSISIISDISILDKLLEIVINKNHGMARQMIVYGLGDYRSKEVRKILLNLLEDEEVLEQAIHALGNMNDRSIIAHLESFKNHSKDNIRNEAINAIDKLKATLERKIILD